jgi:hypothetical protein
MRTILGMLLASVMIVGSGSAAMAQVAVNATTSRASVDVTGPWAGTWSYQNQSLGAGTLNATFQQEGEKLSGNLTVYGETPGRDYTVVGFISGNEIKLSQPSFGTLTVTGDEMSGIIDAWDNARITLRKQ